MSNNPAVDAIKAKMEVQERTTVPGAFDRTPKGKMLDASSTEKSVGPDKRVRWLNLKDPNKVAMRQQEGYVRVPESEGGKVLGDEMATFAIPRERHEARVAAQNAENKRRLVAHKTDMERLAENTARVLRDQHGISVDPRRLFRDEGE